MNANNNLRNGRQNRRSQDRRRPSFQGISFAKSPRSKSKSPRLYQTQQSVDTNANKNGDSASNIKTKTTTRTMRNSSDSQGSTRRERMSYDKDTVSSKTRVETRAEMMKRVNRRRKSMDLLRHTTHSSQIKETLESTMKAALDSIIFEGTPEERLQTIMTKAKESGLTADKIFSFFLQDGKQKNKIKESSSKQKNEESVSHKRATLLTKEQFKNGLEQVGQDALCMSDEELDELVIKFDTNEDDMISLDEFRNYCYFQIPSLAWKAERQRLEKSGEMEMLRNRLSTRLSRRSLHKMDCGKEFCNTTKLFWRTKTTLHVRMYFCSTIDIITIQMFTEPNEEHPQKVLPPLYVRKADCLINQDDLQQAILTALYSTGNPTMLDDEKKAEIKQKVELAHYEKYLLDRLQLKENRNTPPPTQTGGTPLGNGCTSDAVNSSSSSVSSPEYTIKESKDKRILIPFLAKLVSDPDQTITIEKPANLDDPPKIEEHVSMDEFKNALDSFDSESRKARTSRQSAQDVSNLVSSVLEDIRDLNVDLDE